MSPRKNVTEAAPPEHEHEGEDEADAPPRARSSARAKPPEPAGPPESPGSVDDAGPSLEQQITEYAKLGFPALVLFGTALAGWKLGPPSAVLVLCGGALIGVIALFWSSLRTLFGETALSGADAYALGAPRVEEEQKQAVLRALKDLEFERSVGKISEEDYRELVARYRAEAKRLLRLLDEQAEPRRRQVEALVAKRLRRAGLRDEEAAAAGDAVAEEAAAEEAATKDAAATATDERAEDAASKDDGDDGDDGDDRDDRDDRDDGTQEAARVCAACGTVNDEDAVFCKKCGARQTEAATAEGAGDRRPDPDDDADDQARAPREAP